MDKRCWNATESRCSLKGIKRGKKYKASSASTSISLQKNLQTSISKSKLQRQLYMYEHDGLLIPINIPINERMSPNCIFASQLNHHPPSFLINIDVTKHHITTFFFTRLQQKLHPTDLGDKRLSQTAFWYITHYTDSQNNQRTHPPRRSLAVLFPSGKL